MTWSRPYIIQLGKSIIPPVRNLLNRTPRNSCIAETMRRFPIDLYHINDYHGAVAPLHLLPRTIPCCLSLHNAEFQGMFQHNRF